MFSRIQTAVIAMFILAAAGISSSPAQAARPLPRRPHVAAYSAKGKPVRFGYGFAPYVYYSTYGFGGIEGAPNAIPLRYGYGESSYGTSDFLFGQSDFGF